MIKNASFLINFKIHWIMSIMLKLSLKPLIIWLKIPFPTLSLIPFTHPTNRPNSWPFLFTYLEKFIPFSCLHILSQDNSFFKNLLQKKKKLITKEITACAGYFLGTPELPSVPFSLYPSLIHSMRLTPHCVTQALLPADFHLCLLSTMLQ